MLKNILSIKFKKKPSGPEKIIMKSKSSMNPYCSNIIITSVLTGKSVNKSLDPSNGGKGIRLKKAKITFQRIIIIKNEKNMELNEPETAADSSAQSLCATAIMMAVFTAIESVMNFAIKAAASASTIFETGPPKATRAGPHF